MDPRVYFPFIKLSIERKRYLGFANKVDSYNVQVSDKIEKKRVILGYAIFLMPYNGMVCMNISHRNAVIKASVRR